MAVNRNRKVDEKVIENFANFVVAIKICSSAEKKLKV